MSIHVIDFFSGCGGTSAGLRSAGMKVVLGIDCDLDAARTFTLNFPEAAFLLADIRRTHVDDLRGVVEASAGAPLLFCGCAPCQPFSKQRSTKLHPRRGRDLLDHFSRFVAAYTPEFVLCENVPGLQSVSGASGPFQRFCRMLERNGYHHDYKIIECQAYGVPQMRRRLILLASRIGKIAVPPPSHGPSAGVPYETVSRWIRGLPRLEAGATDPRDPVHRAAALSPLNLRRITATPLGGTRLDWPKHLRLRCHSKPGPARVVGHTDVYGRMHSDRPAPALTTRCISLSNGRYGHPTQNRAITAREAACLQTFPRDFVFEGGLPSIARQIGNAVPVRLAEAVGQVFIASLPGGAADGNVQGASSRARHAGAPADR